MKVKLFTNILAATLLFTGCSHPSRYQSILLKQNWKIQQSSSVKADGKEVSENSYQPINWYDAHVPSTVMGILSGLPEYADLMTGGNYFKADQKQFNQSWWYRTTFHLNDLKEGNTVLLQFDGISYYANIWLNGKQITSRDTTFGTFRRFEFNITNEIKEGDNSLALEVFPQQPGDFGLGFVDWNPRPLDANMGIWREVTIKTIDRVQLKNSFVRSKVNTKTLDEAWLTVGSQLKNFSKQTIHGKLILSLSGKEMEYPVTLKAGETKEVLLTSEELPSLHLKNPKLWWCNGLGEPNLYNLKLDFIEERKITAEENIRFGIREIGTYFNNQGHRGFKLNGKEILIKGAGWTDDIFLRDNETTNNIQIKYVKDMGLNTIRFENIWGTSQNIYNLCDECGLLVMAGWSCQWEWDNYLGKPCDNFGGITTQSDMDLVSHYLHDQVLWLRNHPSIFLWMVGSDMLPRVELEKKYSNLFSKLDNRPWLSAASSRISELTGPTGVKMNGPYDYVGPSYWYLDTKNGGAYGFNTETGPGPQLPVIESIEKMIPPDDRWPLSKAWDQHCTSGASMNNMKLQNEVITAQYGSPIDFEDFVRKSHLSNYEAIRAMFEAFRVNRPNSTGIIQWMLNSAWPSLYWQLYDFYLVPTPAYYAVKNALQPFQLIYNYGDRSVMFSNETLQNKKELKAIITVFDINSTPVFSRSVNFDALPNQSQKLFNLPEFNQLAFLKMEITDRTGEKISNNIYWLSPIKEEFNWNATEWYYTPMTKYSDYTGLKSLSIVDLETKTTVQQNNGEVTLSVNLKNTGQSIAFFIELKAKTNDGEWIVPAIFTDNYFTLMPGENRTIKVNFPNKSLKGQKAWLSVSGWNVIQKRIPLD